MLFHKKFNTLWMILATREHGVEVTGYNWCAVLNFTKGKGFIRLYSKSRKAI